MRLARNLIMSALGCAGIAAAAPASAQSVCDLAIETIEVPRLNDLTYDIFDPEPLTGVGRVTIRQSAAGPCRAILTLSSEGSSNQRRLEGFGGDLVYIIRSGADNGEIVENSDSVLSSTAFRPFIPEGTEEVTVEYTVELPSLQTVHSGDYDGTLAFTLFGDETEIISDRQTVAFAVDVIEQLDVSVSAEDPVFSLSRTFETVDFGALEQDETETVFVSVRSTGAYKVSFTSDNQGQLVHERGADRGAVDYFVEIDGAQIGKLTESIDISGGNGPTTGAGEALRVEFRIGDVSRKRAGAYADNVRVTVSPRE